MSRRPATKTLHWASAILMLAVLASGGQSGWLLAFGLVGGVWSVSAVVLGLNGRPGPALHGLAAQVHQWGHRLLYVLIGTAAVASLARFGGVDAPVRGLILASLAAGTLHAVFHLWRHTTLNDNALHMILPKLMHRIL